MATTEEHREQTLYIYSTGHSEKHMSSMRHAARDGMVAEQTCTAPITSSSEDSEDEDVYEDEDDEDEDEDEEPGRSRKRVRSVLEDSSDSEDETGALFNSH